MGREELDRGVRTGGRGSLGLHLRSWRVGAIAASGLALFYMVVVAGASGSLGHLGDQARRDWYYLVFILAGFGLQVALMAELRRRHRLHHSAAVASGTGSGASAVGMIACCAHHLADLLPFVGATGAAAFLIDYRVPFMAVGIGVNAVGVFVAARRLRRTAAPSIGETHACAAA